MRKRYLISDIDHTIANSAWRDHLIPPKGKNDHLTNKKAWDIYHSLSADDSINQSIVSTIAGLHQLGWELFIFTGRTEIYRLATVQWLVKFDIPFRELNMRPIGNYKETHELKLDMFVDFVNMEEDQTLLDFIILDDDPRLPRLFRPFLNADQVILQVHKGWSMYDDR